MLGVPQAGLWLKAPRDLVSLMRDPDSTPRYPLNLTPFLRNRFFFRAEADGLTLPYPFPHSSSLAWRLLRRGTGSQSPALFHGGGNVLRDRSGSASEG